MAQQWIACLVFQRGGEKRERKEREEGEREAVSSREEEERDCQEEVERERLYQEERYLFIQVRLRRASKRPKTLGHVLVAAGHSSLFPIFCFCFCFSSCNNLPWEGSQKTGNHTAPSISGGGWHMMVTRRDKLRKLKFGATDEKGI